MAGLVRVEYSRVHFFEVFHGGWVDLKDAGDLSETNAPKPGLPAWRGAHQN